MTLLKSILLILALTTSAFAQQSWQPTWVTNPLPDYQGKIIEWGIGTGAGAFSPTKQAKAFKFGCTNCVQVQTINGVTQFFTSDSHDVCKPSCTYQGTVTALNFELVSEGTTQFYRVAMSLTGTFKDPLGVVTKNVSGRYHFETFAFPMGGSWVNANEFVPASGGITAVLSLN